MMKKEKKIPIRRLRELFSYNPKNGFLYYNVKRGSKDPGMRAGCLHKATNRVLITISGVKYVASNIIWALQTGRWPPKQVDHANRNASDDRWSNLRLATSSQNVANRRYAVNKHGYTGVKRQVPRPGRINLRYYASIKVMRKDIYLGSYDTPKEAAYAYDKAAIKYFGAFAQTNFGNCQ